MSISRKTQHVRSSSFGWMIQRIASRLDLEMENCLSEHGLSVQQFAVLMAVLENEGQSQTEIGNRFRSPAYAISRAIDQLEKAGFLERRPHPSSRRTHTIFATDKSKDLGETLFGIVKTVNGQLTASLTKQEQEQFEQILLKLTANFAEIPINQSQ